MRATTKSTAALALVSGIKAKHSVLSKDADVMFIFMEEHGYYWYARGARWIKRVKS